LWKKTGLEVNKAFRAMYKKPTQGGDAVMPKRESDRELIDTGRDKRFVRRDEEGRFDESDDVGRSLAGDRKQKAKHIVPPGQGDRGDQERRKEE
jgi:hypothetical protein